MKIALDLRTRGDDELQAATQNARDKKWLPRVQPATKLDDIVPSWKLQMGCDPMPALKGVKCPILAVFGELDRSTPVAQTLANFAKAVAKSGNTNYTVKVFPNADHALLVWPKPDDTAHWPVLAPGYLETMRDWIHKRVVIQDGRRTGSVDRSSDWLMQEMWDATSTAAGPAGKLVAAYKPGPVTRPGAQDREVVRSNELRDHTVGPLVRTEARMPRYVEGPGAGRNRSTCSG